MRKNGYTGNVLLPISGEGGVPIRFTWEAIASLREHHGKEWETEFRESLAGFDTEEIARYLSFATDKDVEWWMAKSPPIIQAAEALNASLELAFLGAGGLPESKSNPLKALRLLTQFWRALKFGSGSEGTRNSSGG